MAAHACIFLSITLWSLTVQPEHPDQLVVWNVGQGQWVTFVEHETCWHFDTGGEFAPWKQVMQLCRNKKNLLTFSHWDWDHISFLSGVRNYLPDSCVLHKPAGTVSSETKTKAFRNLKLCTEPARFASWQDASEASSNAKSRVVMWKDFLIPGDSTSSEEKRWAKTLPGVSRAKILILGHHGSQTSTSKGLLTRLSNLQMAVATARAARYGHPHPRVQRQLRDFRRPLLRTEDWGHIHFWF